MIVEFSVGNYRSFKDIQTLHMQSAKIKSKYSEVDENNVFTTDKGLNLLKSKSIYGANASGKSSLIMAMFAMRLMITDSLKDEELISQFSYSFFALNEVNEEKPVFFQLVLNVDKTIFRYGFELFKGKVASEWLFGIPNKRETYYFLREGQEIKINEKRFREGVRFIPKGNKEEILARENALFLSVLSAFNVKLIGEIVFAVSQIVVITGLEDESLLQAVYEAFNYDKMRLKIIEIMMGVDSSIKDIKKRGVVIDENFLKGLGVKGNPAFELGKEYASIIFYKGVYSEDGKYIKERPLFLEHLEVAEGNKRMLYLSPHIAYSLLNGRTLIIDEFDARLHPNLTRKIVKIFNSKKTNPKNAQLIFATHDSNLLDAKLLRRDQICFVDKDKYGASTLISLVEFKGIRNDASFEKDYLKGKYGGVPNLNKFEWAFEQNETE